MYIHACTRTFSVLCRFRTCTPGTLCVFLFYFLSLSFNIFHFIFMFWCLNLFSVLNLKFKSNFWIVQNIWLCYEFHKKNPAIQTDPIFTETLMNSQYIFACLFVYIRYWKGTELLVMQVECIEIVRFHCLFCIVYMWTTNQPKTE